ncbi:MULTISPECIES: response regulator transcription factor [Niastella]|uniref:Response regulator n=1 Tax=Niastella soli TaxID=2821487 RepID=A0ABS3Z1E3_9BACT|nr:response regulator [Niastella soli]MBO9203848.1 response regulator [Niastella soli]
MKPLILIVDDNEDMLDVISDELNEAYIVARALNGHQALAMLEKTPVQLVVSDIMMPGMDGFELCRHIKTQFEYSHIPLILLTAKNTLQSKITGLETGADAYIEKPFNADYLLAQIANLLTNREKIKDFFLSTPLVPIKSIAPSGPDQLFLEKLNDTICNNLDTCDLDIDKLSKLMNMSRTTLFRKIKSISSLTPADLINITRLKKAAELLAGPHLKIYEVAYMMGYTSTTIFGRNFHKQFGMTPTEYQKMKSRE